jgi:hypothetical protein
VLFSKNIKYPFDTRPDFNIEMLSISISEHDVVTGKVDIVAYLRSISLERVRLHQWHISKVAQYLQYSQTDTALATSGIDALHLALAEALTISRMSPLPD